MGCASRLARQPVGVQKPTPNNPEAPLKVWDPFGGEVMALEEHMGHPNNARLA